jgi:acyl-CoA thioester hydrolase
MADWTETHRAVVHPWNCDVLGHMNVRWYAHLFDDAEFHVWSIVGLSHATLKKSGIVTVIANTNTDFLHEAAAGELLTIVSAFTKLGGKSLTINQRMTNSEDGTLIATQSTVAVFFDMESRKAAAMPSDIRSKLEAVLVTE